MPAHRLIAQPLALCWSLRNVRILQSVLGWMYILATLFCDRVLNANIVLASKEAVGLLLNL